MQHKEHFKRDSYWQHKENLKHDSYWQHKEHLKRDSYWQHKEDLKLDSYCFNLLQTYCPPFMEHSAPPGQSVTRLHAPPSHCSAKTHLAVGTIDQSTRTTKLIRPQVRQISGKSSSARINKQES